MIKLEVEEYCGECKAFNPVSEIIEYGNRTNRIGEVEPKHIQITIRCENAKRCVGIARYLHKELSKKLENETIKDDRET